MFAVIDPFAVEAHNAVIVRDPNNTWKNASNLAGYINSFGSVTRVEVKRQGIGRNRHYVVKASPYLPEAAWRKLGPDSDESRAKSASTPSRIDAKTRWALDGPEHSALVFRQANESMLPR